VEAALAKGVMAKLVVIESNDGDGEGNNKDVYAAFKAVKVEDKVIKEAKQFRVNLVSLTKSYFVALTLTYY